MGTRGIMGIVVNGQEALQYNQFDMYPSGAGVSILAELRDLVQDPGVPAMRNLAATMILVDENQHPSDEEREKLSAHADAAVSTGDDWYSTLRNLQGHLADTLKVGYITHNDTFPMDSLFCEWTYIVDLDAQTFEVYRGFQKTLPTEGRWANRPTPEENAASYQAHIQWCKENDREPWEPEVSTYKAIQRIAHWPLDDLPTDDEMLAIEKAIYGEEEE